MKGGRASAALGVLAIGLIAAGALAYVGATEATRWGPPEPPTIATTATASHIDGVTAVAVGPAPTYAARAREVRRACDLDLAIACRGATCVAVTAAPDLDGPWGWAALAVSSPRFVASTALRDLGVPSPGLPCGQAIARFVGDDGVIAATSGTEEVWCGVDGDAEAGRALCGALARVRHGLPAGGFSNPSLRRRTFDKR